MKYEKSCGAVIWRPVQHGHEYLLAQHGKRHWSFPKGHMEDGETEAQTALREIQEETGLTVALDTAFREIVRYSPEEGTIKDVIFFIAVPISGTECPQEGEIRQLKWFNYEQAQPLVTFATDIDVLHAAERYIRNQSK